MRIISGAAKGIRLATPPSRQQKVQEVRPTSDRAREALFSIVQPYLQGAITLDLFAGTGALGLEALSRGAATAIFIDRNSAALKIVQQNIMRCLRCFPQTAKIRTLQLKLPAPLPQHLLADITDKEFAGFDLIFADPPYGTGLSAKSAHSIATQKLLTANGILVIEERQSICLPQNIASLTLQDRRVYGEVAFHFYQENR